MGEKQGYTINEDFQTKNEDFSYPSYHATESMFLSLYLADKFPIYKNMFMEVSKNISNSRLISCNNYPTDILAGQTLAHILYENHKENEK